MYTIEDLFDMRAIVGAKLERFLVDRDYTKAKFCRISGISRPTLDKLLAGNLTSKTYYEKHIAKALDSLALTSDALMGNTHIVDNKYRVLRNALNLKAKEIAEVTGIPHTRLREIENGAKAELSELRAIAFALHTSVRSVLGTNYFDTQIALLDDFIHEGKISDSDSIHGFWGHIGLLTSAREDYLWFPITAATRYSICDTMNDDRMVIPCMNNKLLYVNTEHIKEIVLLDDACDAPTSANWDPEISCGEIPPVVYETLDDYVDCLDSEQGIQADLLSPGLARAIGALIESSGLSADEFASLQDELVIHYSDGKTAHTDIEFDNSETITDEISSVYEFALTASGEKFLYYNDWDETERFINSHNTAIIELPLFKAEEAICRKQEKIVTDAEE